MENQSVLLASQSKQGTVSLMKGRVYDPDNPEQNF